MAYQCTVRSTNGPLRVVHSHPVRLPHYGAAPCHGSFWATIE